MWWWQLDYWSYNLCKAPVKSSPPTNQHPFFTGRMPFLSPNQQCKALKGKYHIPWTCVPQAHLGVFQLCFWPLIAPGYLGGGLPCLSSALWCQYPNFFIGIKQVIAFYYSVSRFWFIYDHFHWDILNSICIDDKYFSTAPSTNKKRKTLTKKVLKGGANTACWL